MKCRLCRREAERESVLCVFHTKAREALREGYGRWCDAYGELSWKEYLNRVIRNGETGEWAAEVARLMLASER